MGQKQSIVSPPTPSRSNPSLNKETANIAAEVLSPAQEPSWAHSFPLLVKVQSFADPLDIEAILINDRNSRGKELREKIQTSFNLEPSFKVIVFYRDTTAASLRRQMLTDRSLLSPILDQVKKPAEQPIFDYSDFAELTVYELGSSLPPVIIRVSDFTVKHIKEQIEDGIEGLRSTKYTISAAPSELEPRIVLTDSRVKEFCVKSFRLYLERVKEQTYLNSMSSYIQSSINETSSNAGSESERELNESGSKRILEEFDVMISYSWYTKEQVDDLCVALRTEFPGISIWLDREQMKTDIYDGMVHGLTKCKAVIVCLSKPYLESANCTREIRFAGDLKRPLIRKSSIYSR
ncbi:hypothetical protein BCR33DRAFT_110541 [Rhizoclosmatium globosum]|uniref:TIR domain-containing protein n=1 Tax=Rhizoclosmatium globosum TaxID=329046 RepID=A0A1Y2CKG4_9FUNG|nr:hypothetical protein BCR33DRAFT_110541 [Rhizoclosmatium globosum]|eukprot:ORY46825.1 hypothetical protein BCR33DRAFT_110541 [Rhizoclosmatium globosum]